MNLSTIRSLRNLLSDHLRTLPLLVIYLTDGCNSKCAMCDIWKSPRRNIDLAIIEGLAESAQNLGTQMVLLSGGEAMQHPEWPRIAQIFREAGLKVWLLTNGLLLRKQAAEVIDNIDVLTVSLDAATPELYQKIRGVDALDVILDGMKIISNAGIPTSTRTTLMQINYPQMPLIIDTALDAGAQSVSFLAVDTVNPFAFGPRFDHNSTIPLETNAKIDPFGGLQESDLPAFADILDSLEETYAEHFADGRIAESPAKLRNLYKFFAAPYGKADFQPPRCNAPHISAVVNVDGSLQPCYFLPKWGNLHHQPLEATLNLPEAIALRRAYREGKRRECDRCVCPLYRGPRALAKGF